MTGRDGLVTVTCGKLLGFAMRFPLWPALKLPPLTSDEGPHGGKASTQKSPCAAKITGHRVLISSCFRCSEFWDLASIMLPDCKRQADSLTRSWVFSSRSLSGSRNINHQIPQPATLRLQNARSPPDSFLGSYKWPVFKQTELPFLSSWATLFGCLEESTLLHNGHAFVGASSSRNDGVASQMCLLK